MKLVRAYHFTEQQLDNSNHESPNGRCQSPEQVKLERKHSDPGPTRQHSPMKNPTPSHKCDSFSLVEEPWYHGDCSWEEAKEKLIAEDPECFLVRKSQSQPEKYGLSVSYGEVMRHFTILPS